MKNLSTKLLMAGALSTATFAGAQASASGPTVEPAQVGIFAPPNNVRIPISKQLVGTGLTLEQFNSVVDRVENYYKPIAQAQGGVLKFNRLWTDDTANASATQWFSDWQVNMYGGLARHQLMTPDAFMLVACHELGHHLGGAPKVPGFFGPGWASNEGQSDYFGTLQCMKSLLRNDDNELAMREAAVEPIVVTRCRQVYTTGRDQALCERIASAGFVTANVLASLSKKDPVRFDLPDPSIVGATSDGHPAPQCRLDTYFAGALCTVNGSLSKTDYRQGTCHESSGHDKMQIRPYCWFKPN